MAEENILKNIIDSAGSNAENVQNIVEMGNDLIDKLSENVKESDGEFNNLKNEMSKIASNIISSGEKLEHKIEDEIGGMLKESEEKLDDTVNGVDCVFSDVINDLTKFSDETQKKDSEHFGDIKDGMERIADDIHKAISEKVSGYEKLEKMERKNENENEVFENLGEEKLQNSKGGIDDKVNEINVKTENVKNDIIYGSDDKEKKIVGMSDIGVKADNNNTKKDENPIFDEEIQVMKKITPFGEDIPGSGIYHDDYETEKSEGTGITMLTDIIEDKVDKVDNLLDEAFNISKKLAGPGTIVDVINQEDNRQLKEMEKTNANVDIMGEEVQKEFSNTCEDSSETAPETCSAAKKSFTDDKEETTKLEMKLTSDSPPFEGNVTSFTFTNQDMGDAKKPLMPDPSSKNITLPFQSSTSQEALNFSRTSNAPENALQSAVPTNRGNEQNEMIIEAKNNPMQEKIEPKFQGFETLVQETMNPEIEKDELKSEHKTKQNIETSIIEEEVEVEADKSEAKHKMMKKSEPQKAHTTELKQTQEFEAQKTKLNPILPTAGIEPEAKKDKTDTMKSKTNNGQQQQSRRCIIL